MNLFAANLKRLREKAGLTRQQMADVLHITANGYGLYETGRSEPKLDALVEIASTLRVSTDELLGYDESYFGDGNDKEETDKRENLVKITRKIGTDQCLLQSIKETAELTAALAKLLRKHMLINPTPKTMVDCEKAVYEEVADVKNALTAAGIRLNDRLVKEIESQKVDRWYKRVFGVEADV